MAIGSYGTIRPSDVSPEDVQIIMNYTPSRDVTDNFTLTQLDAQTILKPYFNNTKTGGNAGVEVLGGLYNLTLPAEQFNALGIYTLYLRPAQIRTRITDCGVLNALPNVKGVVIDITNVPTQFQNKFVPQGLVGFRIEYLNDDGTKIPNNERMCYDCLILNDNTAIMPTKAEVEAKIQELKDAEVAREVKKEEAKAKLLELGLTEEHLKALGI